MLDELKLQLIRLSPTVHEHWLRRQLFGIGCLVSLVSEADGWRMRFG
jgi:hypothetical protein